MTRPSIIVASVLSIFASPPLFFTTTTLASAQEQGWSDGEMSAGELRDLLRDWVSDSPGGQSMLMDLLQERQDRRADLMDRLQDRRDMRDRLRERIASRANDEEDDGSRRGQLRERLAERRGGDCFFLTRILRDEDQTLLVFVRRRVCRD